MTMTDDYCAAEKSVWEAMKQQALNITGPSMKHSFKAFDQHNDNSLESVTRKHLASSHSHGVRQLPEDILLAAIDEVFHAAKSLGLVMFPVS
jgi:hypothetical protein